MDFSDDEAPPDLVDVNDLQTKVEKARITPSSDLENPAKRKRVPITIITGIAPH